MEPVLYNLFFDIEEEHWWWRSRRAIAMAVMNRLFPGPDPMRVLDVGCGMGAWLRTLPQRFEGYGVDISSKAVEACRNRGMQRVSLSDDSTFRFDNSFFHAVSAFDVLEHLENENILLKEIRRTLRSDGWLLVTVPAFPMLATRWDDLNEHKRRYTKRGLRVLLESNGFHVQCCTYFNFFLFPLALLRRFHENLVVARSDASTLPPGARIPSPWVNRMLETTFSSEKLWLSGGRSFPWGSSVIAWARKDNT